MITQLESSVALFASSKGKAGKPVLPKPTAEDAGQEEDPVDKMISFKRQLVNMRKLQTIDHVIQSKEEIKKFRQRMKIMDNRI